MLFGDIQADPPGVLALFGNQFGSRTVEVRIDLEESHLRRQMGESFGFMLWYFDSAGGQYPAVGFWPQVAPEIDDAAFLGDMTLETIPSVILAQPKELFFRQTQGGGLTEEQQIDISITGGELLPFTIEPSHNWLKALPLEGTTPALIGVRADATSLAAGVYRGKLWIYAEGARNSPLPVEVTLEVVEPPPRLKVSPESLFFSMREGQAPPPAQKISVSNAGGGKLSWQVHLAGDWLEASPLSGEDRGEVVVSVTARPPGTYSGLVFFTASDAEPQKVSVTFEVKPAQPENADSGCGCHSTQSSPGAMGPFLVLLLYFLRRRA